MLKRVPHEHAMPCGFLGEGSPSTPRSVLGFAIILSFAGPASPFGRRNPMMGRCIDK